MKTIRLNTTDIPQLIQAFIEANPSVEGQDYGLIQGAAEFFNNAPGKQHVPVKNCVKCGNFYHADSKNFPPEESSADGLDYKCRGCHRKHVNWRRMKKRRNAAMGPEDVAEIERHQKLMEAQGVKDIDVDF